MGETTTMYTSTGKFLTETPSNSYLATISPSSERIVVLEPDLNMIFLNLESYKIASK